MKPFSSPFVKFEEKPHGVKEITFTRPDVKNAFNAQMISDLCDIFSFLSQIEDPNKLRLVVLRGEGNTFCAGADLNYMTEQSSKSFEENLKDAQKLGEMFFHLTNLPCPILSAVQGAAIGGGLGLCSCSDFVLAEENALFSTSEVRLGLVPAVISPYVIRRIGTTHASHLMLTGERINSVQAVKIGLANQTCAKDEFEQTLTKTIESFLTAEPKAAWITKELIQKSSPLPDQVLFDYTAHQIALARSSKEGKEGLRYFFEKKRPHWCP